jgi:prepilin-type processing-associated H-X9-DG protein
MNAYLNGFVENPVYPRLSDSGYWVYYSGPPGAGNKMPIQHVSRIVSVAQKILVGDSQNQLPGGYRPVITPVPFTDGNYGLHASPLDMNFPEIGTGGQWHRGQSFVPNRKYGRHNDGANIVYVDGHVKWSPFKAELYWQNYPGANPCGGNGIYMTPEQATAWHPAYNGCTLSQ